MKQFYLMLATIVLSLINTNKVTAQTIFTETFGQTTTRLTSPYMPSGSFIWGDPSGNDNQKAIENNHYAVIAPANIREAYPIPFYWFWTGPEPVGNSWGGANNPATNDHTGNANGAVMAVNAGSTLNDFYNRQVTLVPGNSYRLSAWMYLVNANSQFTMGVKDFATNTILGSQISAFLTTEDNWVQYNYDFTYPSGCAVNGAVKIFLSNALSAFGGNDYYIDDISLTTIAGPAPSITCPTTILPIKLESFNATILDNNNIKINWKTSEEYSVMHFIIEKSIDGISFSPLITVQPSNLSTGSNYSLVDDSNNNISKCFYRLKTVNNNGNISYSNTVRINLKSENNTVNIYPQPAINNSVQVSWKTTGASEIELFDATGKKVKTWSNYNYNNLTINGLINALYVIRISQNGKTISKTIIGGQ